MAKHRKHRRKFGKHRKHSRRRFGAFEVDLKQTTRLSAPLAGAAGGFIVGAGLKALISQTPSLQQSVPSIVQNNMILVGGAAAGGLAYWFRHKKDRAAAIGNLTGALALGIGVTIWEALQNNAPGMFSGVVDVNLANGTQIKAMKGLLSASPSIPFPPQPSFHGYGVLASSPMRYRGIMAPSYATSRGPQDVGMLAAGESDPMDDNAP